MCRPTYEGGLGILDIQKMNMTLLTKWVARLMSSRDDLVTKVLKESHGRGFTSERYAAPTQGASPFWQELRHTFSRMRAFFVAQLGDRSPF